MHVVIKQVRKSPGTFHIQHLLEPLQYSRQWHTRDTTVTARFQIQSTSCIYFVVSDDRAEIVAVTELYVYIVSGLITITVHQLKRFEIVLVTVLVVTFFRHLALIRSKIEKAWHVSDIGICLSHLYRKFCFLLAIFAILMIALQPPLYSHYTAQPALANTSS